MKLPSAAIPHLEQYLGTWAIEIDQFAQLLASVEGMDLAAHIGRHSRTASDSFASAFEIHDGLAIGEIEGTITKHGSSLSGFPGTTEFRREMRAIAARPEVKAMLLRIDSPGGTVAGTFDLADDLHAIARRLPVTAFIEDMGASAAYAIASQATRIIANPSALVGSIGTYVIIRDLSEREAREGIRTIVVKAGEFKGLGAPGTKVGAAELAEAQRLVNSHNEIFLAAVARGRGVSRKHIEQLADGRVHVAGDARKIGLVDDIGSFAQALQFAAAQTNSRTIKETKMLTVQQIKQSCPGCDAEFIVAQQEAGHNLDECRDAWMQTIAARLQNREQTIEEMRKQTKPADTRPPGVEPLRSRGRSGSGSAKEEWDELVCEAVNRTGGNRMRAVQLVNRENPGLRESMLDEVNA